MELQAQHEIVELNIVIKSSSSIRNSELILIQTAGLYKSFFCLLSERQPENTENMNTKFKKQQQKHKHNSNQNSSYSLKSSLHKNKFPSTFISVFLSFSRCYHFHTSFPYTKCKKR